VEIRASTRDSARRPSVEEQILTVMHVVPCKAEQHPVPPGSRLPGCGGAVDGLHE
jgi:hypothetical protein